MNEYRDPHFKEQCYFLYGFKILGVYFGVLRYHSVGERVEVRFNWKEVVKAKHLIGFFHSHPPGCSWFSETDQTTMNAWAKAEGKALVCGIKCDGKHRSWLFFKSGGLSLKSLLFGPFFIGR